MLDLGEIKLRAANPSMYRGTVIDRELVGDVRLLIDEVERLSRALELCEVGLRPEDVEEADDLQPCGHPRSAIASITDIGGEYTSDYCSICNAKDEAKVRRDDRTIESPESEPLPEPQEEEVHY